MRYLRILLLVVIVLPLWSCSQEKKEDDKVPLEVKEAEMKDSTRLDPAVDTADDGK